ncbi:MAG: MFS transporter, partial [Armatimonadota bacterium]
MSNLDLKRWIVVFAGVLIVFCSGGAYTFSVFRGPLIELLGADPTKVALAFSLNLGCLPIGVLIGGKIADTKSPKSIVGFGGVLMGLGIFLAGFTNSLIWLYLSFGIIMSLGSGASYGAAIGTAVKWFPDRRGLIAGIVVSALGFGTFVMAPLAKYLIAQESIGVLGTFKIYGIAITIIAIVASQFMKLPPADYVPSGYVPKAGPTKALGKDINWIEMLGKSRFWLLWILYALGS